METIEIGIPRGQSEGLGDIFIYSAVIKNIKKRYPNLNIKFHCPKYIELFQNNPNITELINGYGGRSIDINVAAEHYVKKKLRFFGIDSNDIKPEIFISDRYDFGEIRPIVVFNADGDGFGGMKYPSIEILSYIIDRIDADVFQIGLTGFSDRTGRTYYDRIGKAKQLRDTSIVDLCRIINGSTLFFGANSGPMHIATAYNKPVISYQERYSDIVEWAYTSNINYLNSEIQKSPDDIVELVNSYLWSSV